MHNNIDSTQKSPLGAKAAFPARVLPPRAAPLPHFGQDWHKRPTPPPAADLSRLVAKCAIPPTGSHSSRANQPMYKQNHCNRINIQPKAGLQPTNASHGKRLTCPARLHSYTPATLPTSIQRKPVDAITCTAIDRPPPAPPAAPRRKRQHNSAIRPTGAHTATGRKRDAFFTPGNGSTPRGPTPTRLWTRPQSPPEKA